MLLYVLAFTKPYEWNGGSDFPDIDMGPTFWTGRMKGISVGCPVGAMVFGLFYFYSYIKNVVFE